MARLLAALSDQSKTMFSLKDAAAITGLRPGSAGTLLHKAAKRGLLSHVKRDLFVVNVLAPYLLTALLTAPSRLVYLSSGMHRGGEADLHDPQWKSRPWNGSQAYANSKLLDVVLAFAIARRWPRTISTATEPGWVPTKMGGSSAPDDLSLGAVTQAWLAASDDAAAKVSGGYFYHQKAREVHPMANDAKLQEHLLSYCASVCGVPMP